MANLMFHVLAGKKHVHCMGMESLFPGGLSGHGMEMGGVETMAKLHLHLCTSDKYLHFRARATPALIAGSI